MNVEARKLGVELLPTGSRSSYRSYQQQVDLWNDYQAGRGNLAARPGTSNHGLGLAVDVASQAMRGMIDRIGRKYGWAKDWSDAPSEWWHLKYRAGVWSGSDPGPKGAPPAVVEAARGDLVSVVSATDVLHVFAEAPDGSIWYSWQRSGETSWQGGKTGVSPAGLTRFAPKP